MLPQNQLTIIENQTFDQERALYSSNNILLKNSAFDVLRTEKARSRKAATYKLTMYSATCAILFGTTTTLLSAILK